MLTACDNRIAIASQNLRPSQWRSVAENAQSDCMDLEDIRRGLARPGKSQRGLASKLGLDPAAVNRLLKGERQLKASELPLVQEYLDLQADGHMQAEATLPAPFELSRSVKVLGAASCGDDGLFEFNGQAIEYAPQPPRLRGVPDAYALYVCGESMMPWREEGQLVYVHPKQPPKPGDYVVVQLMADKAGDPPHAYIKRLLRRTATELRLHQYNPAKEIKVPAGRVKTIHRIIDWPELLGL